MSDKASELSREIDSGALPAAGKTVAGEAGRTAPLYGPYYLMTMRRFFTHALALGLAFSLLAAGCASAPSPRPIALAAPRAVEKTFPVPILVLRGTGSAMGEAHGQQLSAAIHTLHEKYLMMFIANPTQRALAAGAAALFRNQLPPELQAEVQGLARGAGIAESEMMLGQCFLDLTAMTACSTVTLPAGAAPDRIARFGRNLEFPSLGIADKYSTLFIVHPDGGRYAFASVGWPGLIGVLSGMNEHGLSLGNMEVTRSPRLPRAMPYTLLYRTVLERCRTVKEAVELLQKSPIQTPNNLMLMDAGGDRAVVELTPESVHVRRASNDGAALLSTNHQRDQDQETPGLCWRYDYFHKTTTATFGRIDRVAIERMLAHVGDETTLQSMIFEPANRVIYLAAGTDAAHRQFNRLDLRRYFSE